jgi:3-hydroxybutyryl-CoA dehydrogenase
MNLSPARCVVGVCGLGQMGASAAVCFSRAGYRVLLWGRDGTKLAAMPPALAPLHAFLDDHVGPPPAAVGDIELSPDLGTIDARADVVLECVTEDVAEKADLLARLPLAAKRQALFLSTTSGLSVTDMGRRSGTQHLLVGAHFWNPAHLMPVVEIVKGADTPEERMGWAVELATRIGKTPVRVEKDVPGFVGNRLLHALWREAIHLVETGVASPADVDLVASLTFGLRLPAVGPFANMDLVGLGLLAQIQSYLLADLSAATGVMPAVRDRLAAGETGMRTGRGFHDWAGRDPQHVVSRRDRQIVHQLKFLRSLDDPAAPIKDDGCQKNR